MNRQYSRLSIEGRAIIMIELERNGGIRKITSLLGRSPSTISREIKRSPDPSSYHAKVASQTACTKKMWFAHRNGLAPRGVLWEMAMALIMAGQFPERIGGRLRRMNPDNPSQQVSHENIDAALYALPDGELRKELIGSLRQGTQNRRPRSRGVDHRGRVSNMVNSHDRLLRKKSSRYLDPGRGISSRAPETRVRSVHWWRDRSDIC